MAVSCFRCCRNPQAGRDCAGYRHAAPKRSRSRATTQKENAGVKLIFLTMHQDPYLAVEAMRSGASGYLLKTSAPSELLHAIQEVLKGRSYITPQIARGMEQSFIRDPRGRQQPKSLTPRQCEVVQLVAEGKSMKEIADLLNVTPRTVAFHKYRTMEELALKSTAELIQFAIKNHIVVDRSPI
jgi:DNA-binding NarL/FixJ family response regulator